LLIISVSRALMLLLLLLISPLRYDGNYFPDTEPISDLPEGTPSALSQQMSAVIGDYFYATLIVNPDKKLHAVADTSQWNSVYINTLVACIIPLCAASGLDPSS
jgi:hypothetical protein